MAAFSICLCICVFFCLLFCFSYVFSDWLIIMDTEKQVHVVNRWRRQGIMYLKDEVISRQPFIPGANCKTTRHGKRQMSPKELCKMILKKICEIWISMNVYPLHENGVTLELGYFYNKFKVFCKQSKNLIFNKADS